MSWLNAAVNVIVLPGLFTPKYYAPIVVGRTGLALEYSKVRMSNPSIQIIFLGVGFMSSFLFR